MIEKNARKYLLVVMIILVSMVFSACADRVNDSVVEPEPELEPVAVEVDDPEPESEPVQVELEDPEIDEPDLEETSEDVTPVNLRFTLWGSPAHIDLLKEIAEDYRVDNPHVTVQFESIPVADYATKVSLQLAGRNKPDLGWMLESPASGWVTAGVLADLSDSIINDESFDYGDFSQSAMKLWVHEDGVYGLPFSTSPMFITYNINLFEDAGIETPDILLERGEWTWEKFSEVAKSITELGGEKIGYVHLDPLATNPWRLLVPVMRAYGGTTWNTEGNQCLMNSPESIEAVQLIHDMLYVDNSIVKPNEMVDFTSGNVGMTMHQLSWLPTLSEVQFEWDFIPLPSGPAGFQPTIGQAAMVVFEESPNREVAIDFLKFIMNKENSAKLSVFFPQARASVLDLGSISEMNPTLNPASVDSAIVESIKQGEVLPSHVEYPKIDLAVRAVFDTMWVAGADIEAAMFGACSAMEPFLN